MHRRPTNGSRSATNGRFSYSSGLVNLLLLALVGIVALLLFTVAPVFTR